MEAYALTAGEYSDYRVLAVFSTKEKLEQFVHAMQTSTKGPAFYGDEINEPETYQLDPEIPEEVLDGAALWHVFMQKDRMIAEKSRLRWLVSEEGCGESCCPRLFSEVNKVRFIGEIFYSVCVCAKSESQALTIASELIAKQSPQPQ